MISLSILAETGSTGPLAVAAVLLPLIGGQPCAAQGRAERDRMALEARELFHGVERSPTDIGRCTFDREWDGRAVLAETARRYLKLTVRADLVVSDPPATVVQVLDPDNARPEAFCGQDERDQVRREALAAFATKADSALRFIRIGYSFPVFSEDYTRAAVAVQRQAERHVRMPDGSIKRMFELAGGAEIYEKRNGQWRRIGYDSYFTAH